MKEHPVTTKRPPANSTARWLPVGAAGALLALVVVAGVVGGRGKTAPPAATLDAAVSAETLAPAPTETISAHDQVQTDLTVAPVDKTPLTRTISDKMVGDDVKAIQQRLQELGFNPGPVDGVYGLMTKQSVWAYEKLIDGVAASQVTGRVTPEMWSRMQDPLTISPRRPQGASVNHTEIYLPQQVLAVFHGGKPVLITHVSSGELDPTGKPEKWCEPVTYTERNGVELPEPVTQHRCGFSKTPGGIFTYDRQVEGIRDSPLGRIYSPVYFNYGIAVHGSHKVPTRPASHGCVRIPMHISDGFTGAKSFQELVSIGERVYVWNGEKEPEQITKKEAQPSWDYPDPDAPTTTTTSTTTTTVPEETETTVGAPTSTPSATTSPSRLSSTTTSTTVASTTTSTTTTTSAPGPTTPPTLAPTPPSSTAPPSSAPSGGGTP